jgi:hypothetical protein
MNRLPNQGSQRKIIDNIISIWAIIIGLHLSLIATLNFTSQRD